MTALGYRNGHGPPVFHLAVGSLTLLPGSRIIPSCTKGRLMPKRDPCFRDRALAYDRRIDWQARLGREIPVLRDLLGPSGGRRVLDAGCGPGRHAVALAEAGYTVTGLDEKDDMLDAARAHADQAGQTVTWIPGRYDQIPKRAPGPFDGCICLGNALAAAGSPARVRSALRAFAAVLVPGGKLFIQVLNFPPLRKQTPCVRGFRVFEINDLPAIALKVFHFHGQTVEITGLTLINDDGWKHTAFLGKLCGMSPDQLDDWVSAAGLIVRQRFGNYGREPFDPETSQDLLLLAEKPR